MFFEAPARLATRGALRRGTAGAGLAEEHERPEIDSPEALKAWLVDRPAEWAQVIAVRAALRVFPLVLGVYDVPDEGLVESLRRDLVLQAFRAGLVSRAAIKYPSAISSTSANAASTATDRAASTCSYASAASASATTAASATVAAASAIARSDDAWASAALSASAASDVAGIASAALWRAVSQDCLWLPSHPQSADLFCCPLWFPRVGDHFAEDVFPRWVREPFERFVARDEVKNGPWRLIVDWYHLSLSDFRGEEPHSFFSEKADIAIATQPDEFWTVAGKRSAEDILEEIAEIAGYRLPNAKRSEGGTFPELIVSFLEEVGRPASLDEIRGYFATFEAPPADTTIRGRLSDLARSGRIILTAPGVYVHPKWQEEGGGTAGTSEDGEAKLTHAVDEALHNVEAQAPAAYRFRWQDNRLEAVPPADIASDPEGAQILLDEMRRKAGSLAERLERSNADKRVLTSVQGLISVLPENVADLRPALLRSRARSVEADAQAYSSPGDEEQFLYPDALAALIDLSETARDLQGYFPSLRELEAEITALAIEPSEVEAVKARLDEIVDEAAGHPEVVGPSAVEALRTMEALANEPAPPAVRQKRIADYALVVRNSVSSVARVALDNAFTREAKRLASDVYDKARAKVVDGIADGVGAMARPATIIAISSLIGAVFGPVAGVAAAAAGFGKVDRLLKLADKLLEKWEKENVPPDTAENEEAAKTAVEADDDDDGSAT